MKIPLVCPYCGDDTTFSPTSDHVYSRNTYGPIWECVPCEARVGCHKTGDGRTPFGLVANKQDRTLRKDAHAAFDPLWRDTGTPRKGAYRWLAEALGIARHQCHIGMMHGEMLEEVVRLSEAKRFDDRHDTQPLEDLFGW